MKHSIASRVAAVAAALVVTTGAAVAQPGPMHHHRGGGDVAMTIAALKGRLNLNTSQQQMWDSVAATARTARDTARNNYARLHDALTAELAKADPDLASVSAVSDDVKARNAALHRQVRDGWLALYATFSPDQKAVVRDALAKRMARMERFHQKRAERHSHG
jgi:Spy/CpxP family protein refolding chaperone